MPERWILSRLQRTIARVTKSLEAFLFNDAANALYDFLWHDFCDWYLEISKFQLGQRSQPVSLTALKKRVDALLHEEGPPAAHAQPGSHTLGVLVHVLETSLRLLHPIMPFVTEELWQHIQTLGARDSGLGVVAHSPESTAQSQGRSPLSIMKAPWPKPLKRLLDEEAEADMARLQSVVTAIRNTRAELSVPLESRPPVRVTSPQASIRTFFQTHHPLLQALALVGDVEVGRDSGPTRPGLHKHAAKMVVTGVEVVMPLAGLIDPARERKRLQQRIDELTKQLSQVEARLRDRRFTRNAPTDVVEQTKTRRAQVRETLKKFSDHLAVIQSM